MGNSDYLLYISFIRNVFLKVKNDLKSDRFLMKIIVFLMNIYIMMTIFQILN